MEYETYETDATYDEMYDEGAKGKVCWGNYSKESLHISPFLWICLLTV